MPKDRLIKHIILPLIAPAALFLLYLTPKSVFGCANRGYMALAVVFLALVGSIVTAIKGINARRHGDDDAARWWIITTLILITPLVLLAGPLG